MVEKAPQQQQHGEMSVINHSTNDKCHMKFDPYSYFGGTPKKVTGTIVSNKDKVRRIDRFSEKLPLQLRFLEKLI